MFKASNLPFAIMAIFIASLLIIYLICLWRSWVKDTKNSPEAKQALSRYENNQELKWFYEKKKNLEMEVYTHYISMGMKPHYDAQYIIDYYGQMMKHIEDSGAKLITFESILIMEEDSTNKAWAQYKIRANLRRNSNANKNFESEHEIYSV